MTKEQLQLKVLTLDVTKLNIVFVGEKAGLTGEDLAKIPITHPNVVFVLTDDVKQIRTLDLEEIKLLLVIRGLLT